MAERDDQLLVLDRLLAECAAGRGQVALVEGPMTSGKTALLGTLAERAADAGFAVLGTTCSRSEQALPFGVLGQLFRGPTLPGVLSDRLAGLPADAMVPAEAGGGPEHREAVRLLHDASLALLDLAEKQPVLLAVDDLRHSDAFSLHWLLHLIRRIGTARVLVALADEAGPRPAQLPFHAELHRQLYIHRLRTAPLSVHGVREIVGAELGPDAAERLTPAIMQAGGGNPVLVHALVQDHAAGQVRVDGYGLALLTCLYRGEPVLLQAVRALAVLGDGSAPADLGGLVGADADDVAKALDAAATAGLLDGHAFRHPAARAAVLDEMSGSEASVLHQRAAEHLYDQGAKAARVAHHLLEGDCTRPPWAAGVLLEAAEQAVLDDSLERAVSCLELVRRCTGGRPRIAVHVRLAQVEWQLNPGAAARHLAPLRAAALAGELSHGDALVLVKRLLWHGRTEEADGLLAVLREQDYERRPEDSAALHDLDAWLAYAHPPLSRLRLATSRAGTSAAAHADPGLQSTAALADALVRGRSSETVGHAERLLREVHRDRNAAWTDESTTLAALTLLLEDDVEALSRWCDELPAGPNPPGGPVLKAVSAQFGAQIALQRGDLRAASDQAREALALMSAKSWGVAIGFPLAALILAATRRGDFEEAARHIAHSVPEALSESHHGLYYLFARGHFQLATGHSHAALADFLSCGELTRGWGYEVTGLVPWRTGAAEAWLRLGNRDQAGKLVHEQLARPGVEASRVRGPALRLLAEVGPAGRRLPLLAEALELVEAAGDRFELARVLRDLSRAYHAKGDKRRARLLFRHALHVAEFCGARPVTRDLMALPADVGGLASPYEDRDEEIRALTDSERRVASLAVMGYTNREIAARLYITGSTVEQHLTRVYRKLKVTRRKDLPADLWVAAGSAR